MRILLVTPACPHPFGDTAARWSYVLVGELVARGHAVSLLTATEESPDLVSESRDFLGRIQGRHAPDVCIHPMKISVSPLRRKLRSLRRPFSEMLQADGFQSLLRDRMERGYDVLHLEQLWTGWLGVDCRRALLNVHHFEIIDREHDRPRSIREAKAMWQMRRATNEILRSFKNVRVFTDRLAAKAREINSAARYWVVPFALDLARYPMVSLADKPTVGLIGSMHWPPSRSAAERLITRIWPIVRSQMPSARLVIAGWNADKHLAQYQSVSGLEFKSNVSHPAEFFSDVSVMVYAPGRGSGMKVKVMESMAFGVPVVTTSEGIEGLAAEPGVHCHVSEDDETLARHTLDLLRNPAAAASMRVAARQLIADQYNPKVVVDRMEPIYEQVARG